LHNKIWIKYYNTFCPGTALNPLVICIIISNIGVNKLPMPQHVAAINKINNYVIVPAVTLIITPKAL